MRANALMKHNIDALLRARKLSRRDLAQWCRRSEAWISKIMREERREFPMKYWDRISDFFGIDTYRLIAPGISTLTERRRGDRRSHADRRKLASRAVSMSAADHLYEQIKGLTDADRRLVLGVVADLRSHAADTKESAADTPASPAETATAVQRPRRRQRQG